MTEPSPDSLRSALPVLVRVSVSSAEAPSVTVPNAKLVDDTERFGVGMASPVPVTLTVTEGVSGSSEGMSKLSLSGPVEVGA